MICNTRVGKFTVSYQKGTYVCPPLSIIHQPDRLLCGTADTTIPALHPFNVYLLLFAHL